MELPGITCGASQIELTTTWTLGAAYEHYWTPQLKTSISGAYTAVEYDSTAKSYWARQVCRQAFFNSTGVQTGDAQGGFNNGNVIAGSAGSPGGAFSGINFGTGTLPSHCDYLQASLQNLIESGERPSSISSSQSVTRLRPRPPW